MKKIETTSTIPALPKGIVAGDTKFANYAEREGVPYDDQSFELWHCRGTIGWVIPTLLIGRASSRRGQTTDRTYAVTMEGKPVRVGKGPHVTATVTVYVRASRLAALRPFLDLRQAGAATAGEIRDRISSRRAQGQVERANGRTSWRWEV